MDLRFVESTSGYKLQAELDKSLPHSNSKNLSEFIKRVLAWYDVINEPRLNHELITLAAGSTGMIDSDLPAGFTRTVIRESLADLKILDICQTLIDPRATATTQIPYEMRDTSAVRNSGVVFEGQGISRASVKQDMEIVYITAMKLAFIISNEVIHFSRASGINWDAYARNVESNARVIRELLAIRISNETQRAADAYQAQDIANENMDSQLTGASSLYKTAQYPIVRAFQKYDLNGNPINAPENPITVTLNGNAIEEYDGSGDQSAGTYYQIINYNLGYIQFVDQAGDPVTPSATGNADTISYSYATNVTKFNLDNGSADIEKHLNGLLRAIGSRKAILGQERYVNPDFLLCSRTLHDTITNAEQFSRSGSKSGTNLDGVGDLDTVKNLPAYGTNTPNTDLGDERILLGQRGTCSYVIAKALQTGSPFEVVNPTTGNPLGMKQAYGEEYNAIAVPVPIRNRLTSVLAYSFSGR